MFLQGLLQRSPDGLAPGEDFSQLLCFSEDAVQAAAAAVVARQAAARRPGSTAATVTATSYPGGPFGLEGVEEWCQRQEAVVLVNNAQVVAFPDVAAAAAAAAVGRPDTAVVAPA